MEFTGGACTRPMAEIRDRYLAPILLSPFADDMARRLARFSIGPVLETCAGTGVLTQAIASAISAGLTIVATDPSAEMLEYASLKPGPARVRWQLAEPTALPFADGTFGVIACHFGVAAVTDRTLVFQEARRVMKSGGHFVFSGLGPIRHNPVADCLQAALDEMFPEHPPKFLEDGLHGYADHEAIDADLTAAGFTDAIYISAEHDFAAASARDVAFGYCLGTPLRSEIEARTSGRIEPAVRAAEQALEKRFGVGSVTSTMRGHFVSASG
jgi:SAM-dependent methyltransferase